MVRLISRMVPAAPAAAFSLLLLAACGKDDPSPGPGPAEPADCAELADSVFPDSVRNGIAQFRVLAPDSGTFRVGQEMRVTVTGVDYTSALVDLVVLGSGGGSGPVPTFPRESIKPRELCEFRFAVPESLTTAQGRRISLVSDSVKVRIVDYNDGDSYDYSDGFLKVTR